MLIGYRPFIVTAELQFIDLIRLPPEKGATGTRYSAVTEEGVTVREIADSIGRGMEIPVKAFSSDDAGDHANLQRQENDPHAMPLPDPIAETIDILKNHTERKKNCLEKMMPRRLAGEIKLEKYETFFQRFNPQMAAHFAENKKAAYH